MRRAARTDSTQAAIVAALRRSYASVLDLSKVGISGCPDLLAGRLALCPYCKAIIPRNVLLEVKTAKGKLNKAQEKFHAEWRGPIEVVRTIDEALEAVKRDNWEEF
jgi:hypothetical protein